MWGCVRELESGVGHSAAWTKSLKLDPFLLLDWLTLAWGEGTDGPFVSAVVFPSGRLSLPILKPRLAYRTEGVTGGTHQSPG